MDSILIDGLIKFCDEKAKNIKLKAEPQVFIEIKRALEDFKILKAKNKPKKILYRKQSYGTPWLCPVCESDQIKVEFMRTDGSEPKKKHSYCWKCGQKIDWEIGDIENE